MAGNPANEVFRQNSEKFMAKQRHHSGKTTKSSWQNSDIYDFL
jgi:hypothetical protein